MDERALNISLNDKYAATHGQVYLTGVQALVRLALAQQQRDAAAGLNTAGFISGYRGSPLGGFDQQLAQAKPFLDTHNIVAQPGINEELAMTAVWGTQKLGINVRSEYDGVFGMWYGKAPGLDRSTDVLKHANNAGTHPNGGVLALAGDDILAKSSTLPCQSDWVFASCEVPFFNPADLQDVHDYGLHGIALSRYSGLWVGLICLADTMDSSGIIRVDSARPVVQLPHDIPTPRSLHNLNRQIILKGRLELEGLLRNVKLPAAQAYVRANGLNRITFGHPQPSTAYVATGKAYRDVRQAFQMLGISADVAATMGIGIYKVAMPWPLESQGIAVLASTAHRIVVVEHKRALMEVQLKEQLYHMAASARPMVFGKCDPTGAPLFAQTGEITLDAMMKGILSTLPALHLTPALQSRMAQVEDSVSYAQKFAENAKRSPYFCSGCPHNSSTVLPEGSTAMAGIGCHIMTEFVDRTHEGSTAMGGEGVPWIGMKPFTKQPHMFVNMGDGTYFHSGLLAIRAAVAAHVPVTYKILYNDAVAMTGGQHVDGELSVPRLAQQMVAEGVQKIVVVSETPQNYTANAPLPEGVELYHRDELMRVQKELRAFPDVSVLIYDQTCAAEKRRRRKRGTMAQAPERVFINDRVCEGCGDCSKQSNCLSVEPLETDFGQKRHINQSSCNKDLSCVKGFCPSFVYVKGGAVRKSQGHGLDIAAAAAQLPAPTVKPITATYDCLITGIGGLGITTLAAIFAMAAHIDGLNALTLDMTGLAQKGGPVVSHVRFAPAGQPIHGAHVPLASTDVLLAADMLVAAQADQLVMLHQKRTNVVANAHIAPTAEFTRTQTQSFDAAHIAQVLRGASHSYHAAEFAILAEKILGDVLYTNMMLAGFALQKGLLPISLAAMVQAIHLNKASETENVHALHAGRLLAATPEVFDILQPPLAAPQSLEARIAFLADELTHYQNATYAQRFLNNIEAIACRDHGEQRLTRAVAENLYKLMAIKDEYEVARLYSAPAFRAKIAEQFEGKVSLSLSLAPPLLARINKDTGRPMKRKFGPWIFPILRVLAHMKALRGTVWDVFGYSDERKMEWQLLADYEADIARISAQLTSERYETACVIAAIPHTIRGFGPVKLANVQQAKAKLQELWAQW